MLRHTDFRQCPRKTQAVKQTKGKGDHPGVAFRQADLAIVFMNNLCGQEQNTQRNNGLGGCRRHMHHTQCRQRQRNAVRHREGRDGFYQFS